MDKLAWKYLLLLTKEKKIFNWGPFVCQKNIFFKKNEFFKSKLFFNILQCYRKSVKKPFQVLLINVSIIFSS